ncbi:MAG: PEGA domain-containing protein [Neisseriaceae bacterium]|jgi:hypothetical protein
MKLKNFVIILASIFSLMSCASMFGDNGRRVTVNSDPAGAIIKVDGLSYGKTPTVITLPTYIYGGKNIVLHKDGYVDVTVPVNAEFQLVGLWNILNFPLGFAIDGLDGNFVKISPDSLNINASLSKK